MILEPGPLGERYIVVAVDALTKWVEVGALKDKASQTTAKWFHEQVTCRYGTPDLVRSDRGLEFHGAFAAYLTSVGCR